MSIWRRRRRRPEKLRNATLSTRLDANETVRVVDNGGAMNMPKSYAGYMRASY